MTKKSQKVQLATKEREESNKLITEIAESISSGADLPDLSLLTVTKREGSIVPFSSDRIEKAIEAAFRDTKKVASGEPLSKDLAKAISSLTGKVVEKVALLGKKGVSLSVEGIQDMVEVTLMKAGHHDVARDYIIYRDHHKAKRESRLTSLTVYRKDGVSKVRFKPSKISASLERLFRSFGDFEDRPNSPFLIESVNQLTEKVVAKVAETASEKSVFSVVDIEDFIEEVLMTEGYFKEAKHYILQQSQSQTAKSSSKTPAKENKEQKSFKAVLEDGREKVITEEEVHKRIALACKGFEKTVNVEELVEDTFLNFYEGIKESEIDSALIMASRAKIEKEPDYTYVTSKLLLDKLYRESVEASLFDPNIETLHKEYFAKYIKMGISYERIAPELLEYDLDKLANEMVLERDFSFQYLGLQTLYDRYFIHHKERRLETPQIFWMRVSMGLAKNEEHKNDKAIEFYHQLSQFYYTSATPTLFNSGTTHSQLSSCYLSTIDDDLQHIFKVVSDDAQLSKWAGGLGNDWTNVRATGSMIKGTNGRSQGVIPFLKVANDTAVAVNQGGKRKGALCSYLETWHLDIEDFLELRKNTGDERRRTHDMNTANWIPDLFMKRVRENSMWTLFTPSETPDLHDLYGKAFEKRYTEYEKMAEEGRIHLSKKINAVDLWRKMLSMLFETGHPWITFKDPSNIRSPQDHKGVVHSSNLCTEILLNTSREEVAVCNLGSVNLVRHLDENGKINEKRLEQTVRTAIRMLDNVIDINFYPIKEARDANLRHRAIGLGIMGFQDALYIKGISYASKEAIEFADEIMESISYYAILASSELAKERGTYESYKGSKWDRGYLPIDTIDLLEEERGLPVEVDRKMRKDWSPVRESVKKYGMRNCNTMAIAPTATIANIAGVTASIEPTYKNLYVKSNLSGEFTVPNRYLIDELKKRGLWNDNMLDDLKYYDGSVLEIEEIPEDLKKTFVTAFEIDPNWTIECAARRQKWIDMGQSLNLYLAEPSGKKLNEMYMLAWKKGLKTTYYLRSVGATQVEKSTTDINKRSLQPRWMKNASASSNIKVERDTPKTPVCNLEEGCESCQ